MKAKTRVVFQRITVPNMHGVVATVGNRRAEVVEVDSCCGAWHCGGR